MHFIALEIVDEKHILFDELASKNIPICLDHFCDKTLPLQTTNKLIRLEAKQVSHNTYLHECHYFCGTGI